LWNAVQCQVTLNNESEPVWSDTGQQKVLQRPDVYLEDKAIIRRLRKKPCNHYLQRHEAATEIAPYGQTIFRQGIQKVIVKGLEMKREGKKGRGGSHVTMNYLTSADKQMLKEPLDD
jgi:hypothetical protein